MSPSDMTEAQAEALLCKARWPETDGAPICPACGAPDAYGCRIRTGLLRFRCRGCRKDFSVTSGTLFAGRKLPAHRLVRAVDLLLQGVYPYRIARETGLQYKTVHVLAWKMREVGLGADGDLTAALSLALTSGPSERFTGYWQRHHTPKNAKAPERGLSATNKLGGYPCPSI